MNIYTLINKILFEEEDWYYPYLDIVLRHINDKNLNINSINKFIIEKNKNNYDDYFEGKTWTEFKAEVVNASIQLRENPSKHISTSQQHLIIDFLDNYIYQLKQLRKKGILFFRD